MRSHVVKHMGSSIYVRIVPHEWPGTEAFPEIYECIRNLRGDAWIVGRITMAKLGKGEPRPASAA